MIAPGIFRAYDIRGIVGQGLDAHSVRLIGQAIGSEALEEGQTALITGADARLSSPELANALQQGILASGCNVIDLGVVPTPLVYFATHTLESASGVMLTGSHNPRDYNGIKIVLNQRTLAANQITRLYERIVGNELEREATHVLDTVVNPKKTMAQMLTQFSQLTIVQDFMSGNVMDRDANRNSVQTSSSSPINMAAPRLKLTAATPGVGSGTEDGPSPEIIRMASEHHPIQLKVMKAFLALAFNHNYITHRNEESLNNLKKKIIEKKATTLPNDYNAAIRLIDDQLKIRFPKEM